MSTDDELVLQEYRKVITWVMEQTQFSDAAKAEFASVADSWLIAYSKAYDFTIVTNEQYQPHIKEGFLSQTFAMLLVLIVLIHLKC